MRKLIAAGVIVLAAAITAAVWLLSRSGGATKYATPEEAVLKVCHADPAKPPQNFGTTPGGSSAIASNNQAFVRWTSMDAHRTRFALARLAGDGKTWIVDGCNWTAHRDYREVPSPSR